MAHQVVASLDVEKLENIAMKVISEPRGAPKEGFEYYEEIYKTSFSVEHHIGTFKYDKDGNVIYSKDKNGNDKEDIYGKRMPQYHY
ncbi:hypothetical protein V4B17_02505 [Bartonella sp. B23]